MSYYSDVSSFLLFFCAPYFVLSFHIVFHPPGTKCEGGSERYVFFDPCSVFHVPCSIPLVFHARQRLVITNNNWHIPAAISCPRQPPQKSKSPALFVPTLTLFHFCSSFVPRNKIKRVRSTAKSGSYARIFDLPLRRALGKIATVYHTAHGLSLFCVAPGRSLAFFCCRAVDIIILAYFPAAFYRRGKKLRLSGLPTSE